MGTTRVTNWVAVPPAPVHTSAYFIWPPDVGVTEAVPVIGLAPLHPFDAVQVVASVELQVTVAL